MKVSNELVEKIASLSKLEFNGEQKKAIQKELENMLNFVEKINELDTDHVEPLIHLTQEVNHYREDIPVQILTHEEALKNAPKKDSDYIRVPKVIEKG